MEFDSTAPSNHPVGVSSNSGVLFVFCNLGLQGCMSFQFLKSPSVLYVVELVDGVSFSKKKNIHVQPNEPTDQE